MSNGLIGRLLTIFVLGFLTFIVALNLIKYGAAVNSIKNVPILDGVTINWHSRDGFVGFRKFFEYLASFNGLTHTIETFNTFSRVTMNMFTDIATGFDGNDFLSILAFIGECFIFIFQFIGAILLDIISIFSWFFGIIWAL